MTDKMIEMAERQLPEAPHWNGHGKCGPALVMDNCTLHIMSRGFGTKDGDGYLTHDPSECDWERDEDGKDYVVVPVSNSDLLFLRDQLNELFPTVPSVQSNASEAEADAAIAVLEKAIDAARNSNQAGENAVVRAAAALTPNKSESHNDG